MGTLFVDKLDPQSGTSLELGSSGDTVSVNTGATTSLLGNVTLGASGKTITVPSGATIANSGTATGFGESNTPAFQAYLGAKQTVSSGTTTKINLNTEVFDSDSMYDASTNYRFTPTIAGKYFCFLNLELSWDSGYGDVGEAEIQKNGSSALRTRFVLQSGTDNGFYAALNVCGVLEFNGSSDYIEPYCFFDITSGNGRINNNDNSIFGAYKLIT